MTSPRRTQKEAEQTVKVYQLDAVEAKVDQAINKIDQVIVNTTSVVTQSQLEKTVQAIEQDISEAKKEIHAEYGPMKKNIGWFLKALVAEGILIAGQIVIVFIIAKG